MTFIRTTRANRTLKTPVKIEKVIMPNELKYILLFIIATILIIVVGACAEEYIKGQNNVLKDLPPNTEIKLNNKSYIYTGKALILVEDK